MMTYNSKFNVGDVVWYILNDGDSISVRKNRIDAIQIVDSFGGSQVAYRINSNITIVESQVYESKESLIDCIVQNVSTIFNDEKLESKTFLWNDLKKELFTKKETL